MQAQLTSLTMPPRLACCLAYTDFKITKTLGAVLDVTLLSAGLLVGVITVLVCILSAEANLAKV